MIRNLNLRKLAYAHSHRPFGRISPEIELSRALLGADSDRSHAHPVVLQPR